MNDLNDDEKSKPIGTLIQKLKQITQYKPCFG